MARCEPKLLPQMLRGNVAGWSDAVGRSLGCLLHHAVACGNRAADGPCGHNSSNLVDR